MRQRLVPYTLLALVALFLVSGCAQQYVITTELTEPLGSPARLNVGPITDQLPATVESDAKPSAEDIQKFKSYLEDELTSLDSGMLATRAEDAEYEVTGGIMQYTKGSGFLRFLIGFGAGSAKVLTELKVVDIATDRVVFAGNFEGSVTSWAESGDQMFRKVAQNFAKELRKQNERESK